MKKKTKNWLATIFVIFFFLLYFYSSFTIAYGIWKMEKENKEMREKLRILEQEKL